MPRKKTTNLYAYTERAIRATEAGKLIPSIVYLPRMLRDQPVMLSAENCALTVTPPTLQDNQVKINESDPLGFLIAVMNGQPIPEFRITAHGGIELFYECPEMKERIIAANYLGTKIIPRTSSRKMRPENTDPDDAAYQAMIRRASASALVDADDAAKEITSPPEEGED